MGLHQTKKLLHSTRLKGKPTEWEKILASYTAIWQVINNQKIQAAKNTNFSKNQEPTE
jgi:hypothetical protein